MFRSKRRRPERRKNWRSSTSGVMTRPGVMEIENLNPVCASCRQAEALGYPRRSQPARARAESFLKDHKPWLRSGTPCGLDQPGTPGIGKGGGYASPAGASCAQGRLMEIEKYIRYAPRAVGLKPPANQGEARLRGLYRIISSKTISPRLSKAKPACAGYVIYSKTITPRVIALLSAISCRSGRMLV